MGSLVSRIQTLFVNARAQAFLARLRRALRKRVWLRETSGSPAWFKLFVVYVARDLEVLLAISVSVDYLLRT